MLNVIRKINKGMAKIEDVVTAAAFAVVFAVITVGIVLRFVFNNPLIWSEEFSRYTYVWIVWLGCASCASRSGHTRITVLYDQFPAKVQRFLTVFCNFVMIAVLLYILPYGAQFAIGQQRFKSGVMRIPMGTVFFPVAVTCVLTSIQILLATIEFIADQNAKEEGGNLSC